MRKSVLILISLLYSYPKLFSQVVEITNTPVQVKFLLYSPVLSDTDQVYISGSLPELGSWNPAKVMMHPVGNHRWEKTITVMHPVSIEYKFTLGSWNREACDADGRPFQNYVLNVMSDTAARNNILFWENGKINKTVKGQITGTVKYLRQVKGMGLLPRDVVVWLPPGYRENKPERYPVLYMQDGQNLFDPATSAFGVDWGIDEACDSLIRNHIIEPIIVVGIYNTADRSLEYTPGDTGDQYMKFMVTELKPLIDSKFRTITDRDHTYVGGSSAGAGALISFMLVWQFPEVFSDAICFSPAFKIMNIDYVTYVKTTHYVPSSLFIYIYNGGIGLDSQLQAGVNDMLGALKDKGYIEGKNYYYVNDPQGRHTETDWSKQFPRAIRMCLMGQ